MSFLTEINCVTILEAIKDEKKIQITENESSGEYVKINLYKVNTFWTDLFANCFLCYDEPGGDKKNSLTQDDMLFFVNLNKNEPEKEVIEVYRRDSKLLPCLTDLNYNWEETVYLNLILHEFEYTLTCAICTQTGTKDLEILKRHSKRVYASPSKRDLASKGTEETLTYPNLYFIIDDFDDAFNDMIVNENEMVCVELLANDGKFKKVLFLGSIKYESLKKVYDNRASAGSKLVQKFSMGSYSEKRVEFVKMKGPAGKGHAEMAVSQFQKSGPPTNSPDTFNTESLQNMFKLPSVFKRNKNNESGASNNHSIWNRTLGHALTWLNKTQIEGSKEIYEIPNYPSESNADWEESNLASEQPKTSKNNQSAIPLNAYLTYVTLRTQIIMQDVLDARHKSLLTV